MKRLYLSDTVAGEIGSYITENQLEAGDRLPSVSEWMTRLQVGRSTLREGVKRLEAEGVIKVVNGRGIFVSDQQIFRLFSRLHVTDARQHLLEMLDVRQVLEGKAVALATVNACEAQFDEMAQYLEAYRQAREDDDFLRVHEADSAFHLAIYRASGNQVMVELIRSIHSELYASWQTPEDRNNVFDDSFPHHLALLEAMRQRDVVAASAAYVDLMASTRHTVEIMA
ncbi:FadR/GntR family transcriptional regulator [Salinicola avicenniae]|uniref:FadR/GntR family transcriptional regulator n=1 Tax=Salinicola avicenniae TaxID=2916836 RepID=UPI0020743103|nr:MULTISPECIES: FadR/GntR family transcriptional regulator [unclassified Salinicola]